MRSNGGELATVDADGEVLDLRDRPEALGALTRAEIDAQVATAKKYPRSVERFLREARTMVAISGEIAEKCTYTLPARQGGDGRPITGPSVRLAEIVACCWGNLRISGRVIGDDGTHVTAQGVAVDLEKNLGYSIEAKRGVVTRKGQRFGPEMVATTCNAAIAIATRNATFKAVPRAFVDAIHEEARAVARGDVKTLPERTRRALDYFKSQGVPEANVFRTLGVVGASDMTLDHLAALQGFRTAVQEGHETIRGLFYPEPRETPRPPGESRSEELGRRLVGREPAFAEGTAGKITSEPEEALLGPKEDEPGADG